MTAPNMVLYLRSGLDELTSGIAAASQFWSDDDIYLALNNAQVQVAMDSLAGEDEDAKLARNLIVIESVADGASFANAVMIPLCVFDVTGTKHVMLRDATSFVAYQDMTLPSFGQACVYGDAAHSTPASTTYSYIYAKFPPTIDSTHDCVLDTIAHPSVVEAARMILLRKDIGTPLSEAIEQDRNRLEVFKKGKPTNDVGYQPRPVPYSER